MWPLAALALATATGLFLRVWRTDVPFHSGDFASMPFMVSHWWGWQWIAAHIHGPVQPAVTATFARIVVACGGLMNETMWRLPCILFGALHIPLTYLLMRRLAATYWIAVMAAAVTAVLPSLTSDARYPWGYETLAVCIATAAVWAWLRSLDRPGRFGAWLAGGLIGLYLVSHLVIHAVPVLVVAAAVQALGLRGGVRRLLQPSLVVPVAMAAVFTIGVYWQLDGGIFSRVGRHVGHGTLHVGGTSPGLLWSLWRGHLGPIWAGWCMLAIAVGMYRVRQGDRRGLPALWALAFAGPLFLLLDLDRIGRTTTYQIQGTWAASLAGCMMLQFSIERINAARWRIHIRELSRHIALLFGGFVVAAHLLGSTSNLFTAARWPWLTGTVDYGCVVPDPGFKAAGWYVRRYVPSDAVVLATHDIVGMESPAALYYAGRHVAAGENMPAAVVAPIIESVRGDVDVVITDARFLPLLLGEPGFEIVVRFMRDGEPILYVAARPTVNTPPEMNVDVAIANREYDRLYRLDHVPTMLDTNPRVLAVERRIASLADEFRKQHRHDSRPVVGEVLANAGGPKP
jgi:hypothetical protein